MAAKYVKVSRMGALVKEVCLENGEDVQGAIELAGETVGLSNVKVNGKLAETTDSLKDGDIILIVPAIKGA